MRYDALALAPLPLDAATVTARTADRRGQVIPFPAVRAQTLDQLSGSACVVGHPRQSSKVRVLIVAIEDRWGVARLPKHLVGAGFEVAALCAPQNILASTTFVQKRFDLPTSRSAGRLGTALATAMRDWRPTLVIPADEQIVALLHALAEQDGRKPISGWTSEMRSCLELSLGHRAQRPAMLLKSRTQELARAIGVLTPAGGEISSLQEALELADGLGYPVVAKQPFGCSGVGVMICRDSTELRAAYAELAPQARSALTASLRKVLGRDWFPNNGLLSIQQYIEGDPAMYTFSAYDGRMLAGFAALKRQTSNATGPSSVVECGADEGMADAARKMVEAMGATGFAAFDFMIERKSGRAYLIESNPRPNQVPHLGERLGANLCAALFQAANGLALPESTAARSEVIALFPQEWMRNSDSRELRDYHHDVPFDEPELMSAMVARASTLAQLKEPAPSPYARRQPWLAKTLAKATSAGSFIGSTSAHVTGTARKIFDAAVARAQQVPAG